METPTPARSFRSVPSTSISMFVGSPDQIGAAEPELAASHPQESNPALPDRPDFPRSVSSPLNFPMTRKPGRSKRVVSGMQRLSQYGRSPVETREWTVFGQILENDGLTTPKVEHPPQKRHSLSTSVSSIPNGFFDSRVQSPDETPPITATGTSGGPATDYDSDDTESTTSPASSTSTPPEHKSPWSARFEALRLTPLQRNILKCSVAYLIGSLFTFVPQLSGLITAITSMDEESLPSASGHMVATV